MSTALDLEAPEEYNTIRNQYLTRTEKTVGGKRKKKEEIRINYEEEKNNVRCALRDPAACGRRGDPLGFPEERE